MTRADLYGRLIESAVKGLQIRLQLTPAGAVYVVYRLPLVPDSKPLYTSLNLAPAHEYVFRQAVKS